MHLGVPISPKVISHVIFLYEKLFVLSGESCVAVVIFKNTAILISTFLNVNYFFKHFCK